jgi:putative transposase
MSLPLVLRALGMARSTYYFELGRMRRPDADEGMRSEIKAIFGENKGRYGVRRVLAELRGRGRRISRKKVQRLMHAMGLRGACPKEKYHSFVGEVGKIAPNVISRDFSAGGPDEKWTTDVSEFACPFGKCYLSPIKDMFTSEIISYDLSMHPDYSQTRRMLERAFALHPDVRGLIMHSDQGWQYQMRGYSASLREMGIVQSMSRRGNCIDNCIMETFFAVMKREMFYGHEKEFDTFEAFTDAVRKYIDYYNGRRISEKTKWMPPLMFREASMSEL